MTDKQVRLGDILNIENFDPMNVDVTYIQSVSHMVPKDGTIDLHEAEKLATTFLSCADYCGELISQAIRLMGYKDANKKSKKADAIERKVAGGTPATTAKETFSNDAEYTKACQVHADAEAFLVWVKQKYENLIKAHVLCKDLLKAHVEGRNKANWEGVDENFDAVKDSSEKLADKTRGLGDINITSDDFVDID